MSVQGQEVEQCLEAPISGFIENCTSPQQRGSDCSPAMFLQLHFNLYGIPVPSNYTNPDILLTLNATSGGTGLGLYCNPGYGEFADPNGNYPGPGYAQWFSGMTLLLNLGD